MRADLNDHFKKCESWDYWNGLLMNTCKLWDSIASFEAGNYGDDAHISFTNPYTLGTGNFTVEGWVWLENTPSGNERTIISKMHVNPFSGEIGGFRLFVNAMGRLQFTVGDAPVTPSGPGRQASITYNFALPNQQWIHVIAVRNGNNPNLWQMYVNGMMVPCIITGPTLPTGNIEQGAPHFIDIGGGAMVGNPKSWNGRLKKVRLYTGILSPTIINNTYNNGCGTDFAITASRLDAPLYERLTPTTTREYSYSQTGTLTTVVPGQLQWNAYWKDSSCTASDTTTLWCKQVLTYRGKNAARYGFNGKERDDEAYGEGGFYDYGMRVYDSRLGKFLSVDPLSIEFPWNSSYAFAENSAIAFIDLDGLEKVYALFTTLQNPKGPTNIQISAEIGIDLEKETIVYHGAILDRDKIYEIWGKTNFDNNSPLMDPQKNFLDKILSLNIEYAGPRQTLVHKFDDRWTNWKSFEKIPIGNIGVRKVVTDKITSVLESNKDLQNILGANADEIWNKFKEAGGTIWVKYDKFNEIDKDGNVIKTYEKKTYRVVLPISYEGESGETVTAKLTFDYVDDSELPASLKNSEQTNGTESNH